MSRVESECGLLRVTTDSGSWLTGTLVNATGTWDQPFLPATRVAVRQRPPERQLWTPRHR